MEDIFHATRAACRIGAFDDSHLALVDMLPSAELEALLHGRVSHSSTFRLIVRTFGGTRQVVSVFQ
jgi:hypothetical protein